MPTKWSRDIQENTCTVHINCLTSYNAYVCICCLNGQFSLCKALGDVHTYAANEEKSFVASWTLS